MTAYAENKNSTGKLPELIRTSMQNSNAFYISTKTNTNKNLKRYHSPALYVN